jgi:membrane fusion protein, copper/silver efflux system
MTSLLAYEVLSMRNRTVALLLLIVAAGFFLAGYSQHSTGPAAPAARKVLYYADPMNPAFRGEKPGIAPCGMPLEPVYADGMAPKNPLAPGQILVQPGMEQLIGVKVEAVEKAPWSQTIRMPGTVVPDENRVFRVTAATDGWVKKVLPPTSDSMVSKDEVLATFYAPEFFSGLKAYLYALRSMKRTVASDDEAATQIDTNTANLESYKTSLRNLGMTEPQLNAIQKSMQGTDNVEIRSPASGLILNRNVSNGQRFAKGSDLYRIADLSRVWILVDVYDDAALLTRPGMRMEVTSPYLRKPILASLTNTPPRFDPATRTLKLRLAADNPGYLLRPDMFVDVEFKVSMPAALTVPSEAVLDSGLRKNVFVELSPGRYEPRAVETGRATGDRVEIVKGLKAGERVVVSGNFLLDSESRMKSTKSAASGVESSDPSCGMLVDQGKAKAAGFASEYQGKSYYFCSGKCKAEFDRSPAKYLTNPRHQSEMQPPGELKPQGDLKPGRMHQGDMKHSEMKHSEMKQGEMNPVAMTPGAMTPDEMPQQGGMKRQARLKQMVIPGGSHD